LIATLEQPNKRRHKAYQTLGRSSLALPRLGFGAAPIGNLYRPMPEPQAIAAVESAWQAQIGYFDTAPHYGFGLSERRLGAALKGLGADHAVVSTKVGRLLEPLSGADDSVRYGFADAPALTPVFDYSYDGVMRSFESSLERLGRDSVDIIWAHDLGAVTHGREHPKRWREFMEGGYPAMEKLRAEGRVKAIGLGANEWEVCEQALAECSMDGFLLAGRYTLLEQGALNGFLPLCARRGVTVVLGGPFNSAILARGVSGSGPHYYNYEPASVEIVAKVARIEAVCREFEVPLPAAALQFPGAHPQICSVLAGLANEEEVQSALTWMNTSIPRDLWGELKRQGLLHPDAPVPGGH